MEIINIYEESDFEKLRFYEKHNSKVLDLIINVVNDIEFTCVFMPLNLRKYNVTIIGNNKTLSRLLILESGDNCGIFKEVNSLKILDLSIKKAYLRGGTLSGIFAGRVSNTVLASNINLDDVTIDAEAYSGSICGRAGEIILNNSNIDCQVYGIDVVGGIVGISNSYFENNSNVKASIIAIGKALGDRCGYTDKIKIDVDNPKLAKHFHFL